MREIKFRAWHFNYNSNSENIPGEMLYYDQLRSINENGYPLVSYGYSNKSSRICHKMSHEIMQYTGLKDTNGIEIYENDIVNYGDNSFIPLKVIFNNGAFVAKFLYSKASSDDYDFINCISINYPEDWQVIGNIYENKELLEDKFVKSH